MYIGPRFFWGNIPPERRRLFAKRVFSCPGPSQEVPPSAREPQKVTPYNPFLEGALEIPKEKPSLYWGLSPPGELLDALFHSVNWNWVLQTLFF